MREHTVRLLSRTSSTYFTVWPGCLCCNLFFVDFCSFLPNFCPGRLHTFVPSPLFFIRLIDMFSLRFISVLSFLSLAVFATATPLVAKRQPYSQDLVNLYLRTDDIKDNGKDNSTSSDNSTKVDDNNKNDNNDNNDNNNNNGTSLNDYAGLESMKGFDDFRGAGNFDGSRNAQVVVVQEQQVVCQRQQIEIIQQRLVILQEMAKRIVTELVCDVETQTIVIEQLQSGIVAFQKDVKRETVKQVGFDQNVASLSSKIVNDDGSLNVDDLNFKGSDVGGATVVPSGNNWNDDTSPESVQKALDAAKKAGGSDEL